MHPEPSMDNDRAFEMMIRYEEVGLTTAETIELFQYLVDTGMAWRLQGFYGRQAMALIEEGFVIRPGSQTPSEAAAKSKRRGRPSTKLVGALVEMAQRRIPGRGIIIERLEDRPHTGHDRFNNIVKEMESSGHVDYDTAHTDNHQNFVLVHWFSKPSDYNVSSNWHNKQWYPDKWVKVVSAAPKKEKVE